MRIVTCDKCVNYNNGECGKHPEIAGEGSYCSDGVYDITKKKTISIFSPQIAKALLKKGHQIKDIVPNKNNKDKTVFIFDAQKEVIDFLNEVKQKKGEKMES